MRRLLVCGLLALTTLAGCLGGDGTTPSVDDIAEEPFVPRVVVAILDTGLNPYHDEFRQIRPEEDPVAHPSRFLTGYPGDAAAIPVSFDLTNATTGDREVDWERYMEHDSDQWNETEPETLYWIPGTKLVGIIGFDAPLPGAGHGSMTTSRAGGNTISIPGAEVLVVHVVAPLSLEIGTVGDDAQARATRWMADQPFIDIQSHSWGMPFTCAGIATTHLWGWAEAFKYARDRQLVMVAAANGHGNTGTLGYPSQCQDNSGIAGVVTVGGTDNAGYPSWANWFPAISGDGCSNPAIVESSVNETANTGGGTSSATPFSAGGAAKVVLEARRILRDPRVGVVDGVVAQAHDGAVLPEKGPLADGTFTLDELKDVLFHTAISPPREDPSDGDTCGANQVPIGPETPALAVFPLIGYGEINGDSVTHAVEVLQGLADLLERPEEDELYAQDQAARRAFWG